MLCCICFQLSAVEHLHHIQPLGEKCIQDMRFGVDLRQRTTAPKSHIYSSKGALSRRSSLSLPKHLGTTSLSAGASVPRCLVLQCPIAQ